MDDSGDLVIDESIADRRRVEQVRLDEGNVLGNVCADARRHVVEHDDTPSTGQRRASESLYR